MYFMIDLVIIQKKQFFFTNLTSNKRLQILPY